MRFPALLLGVVAQVLSSPAADEPDLGSVAERHVMIPMRDGAKLSAYLYFPKGDERRPVLFEQRYADLRGAGTRKAAAQLAERGFVVALVNFRGTHLSEGTWVGYRALGWGELQDGYDACEWLAAQPWSSGKVGSFGSSQGGYAQNCAAPSESRRAGPRAARRAWLARPRSCGRGVGRRGLGRRQLDLPRRDAGAALDGPPRSRRRIGVVVVVRQAVAALRTDIPSCGQLPVKL